MATRTAEEGGEGEEVEGQEGKEEGQERKEEGQEGKEEGEGSTSLSHSVIKTRPPIPHFSQLQQASPAAGEAWNEAGVSARVECPPNVLSLYQNADLNLPPPNWLRAGGPTDFLHSTHRGEPSSVVLASHYPTFMGQVDVIADAKNIKKLLKMPYNSSHMSMAVHRIGKTLLIDEFTGALLRQARVSPHFEKLSREGELPPLLAPKKDPEVTRHKNMFSKLLYYSVQNTPSRAMLPAPDLSSLHPQEEPSISESERLEAVEEVGGAPVLLPQLETQVDSRVETAVDSKLSGLPLSERGGQLAVSSSEGGGQLALSSSEGGGQLAVRSSEGRGQLAVRSSEGGGQLAVSSSEGGGQLAVSSSEGGGQLALSSSEQLAVSSSEGGGQLAVSSSEGGGQLALSSSDRLLRPLDESDAQAEMVDLAVEIREGTEETFITSRAAGPRLAKPEGCGPQSLTLLPLDVASPPILRSFAGRVSHGPSESPDEPPAGDLAASVSQLRDLHGSEQPAMVLPSLARCTKEEATANEGVEMAESSTKSVASVVTMATKTEPEEEEEGDLKPVFPYLLPKPAPQPFHLNFQWTIEDIRMLLGSDLPIFGGAAHPAISLRLRDSRKPITVLTGLDYWLDNLMCNVPELAMCFHLDGIVQRYETLKTEDIPYLENCQFSPQEVLEVAQNILAFLKANCTREGHTYWLFRRKGEDVVKLYDLTSLNCFEESNSGQQNPFAMSVATLFYRVAQSLLLSGERLGGKDLAMGKMLLENCIRLMGERERSQVVVSAHYMLAELFLSKAPAESESGTGTSPENRSSDSSPEEDGEPPDVSNTNEDLACLAGSGVADSKSLSVNALRQGPRSFSQGPTPSLPPLVLGTKQDRARIALEHISKGLSKLDRTGFQHAWQAASGCGLLQQAGSAYLMLAEAAMGFGKLGRCLRYARYSILCTSSSQSLAAPAGQDFSTDSGEERTATSTASVRGTAATFTDGKRGVAAAVTLRQAWEMSGDVHCLGTKVSASFSSHLEDFQLENPEDAPIITMATNIHCIRPGEKPDLCLTLHTDLETSLLRSIDCYEFARQLPVSIATSHQRRTVQERLGNAWNELGVYYLHVASSLDFSKDQKQVEQLWSSSYSSLMDGLAQFQGTGHAPNQALLYANLGSLMRSCAQAHDGAGQGVEFSPQEKLYYDKAAEFYIKGKQALRRRWVHPGIWTSLVLDLSGIHLTTGRLLQERAPLSNLTQQEVEREVVEVLMKALQQVEPELSHVEPTNEKFVSLSQRAGDCHYRLASLYQKAAFTLTSSSQRQKHSRTQAEKHYSKALHFYQAKHHAREMVRVLLEKALLYEQQAQGKQLRPLQSSLGCLLQCHTPLQTYPQGSEGEGEEEEGEGRSLLAVMVHRLQAVLKKMVALCMRKSDSPHLLATYKSMYAVSLRTLKDQSHEKLLASARDMLSTLCTMHQEVHR